MLKSIDIKALKSFKSKTVSLNALTLLSGLNNSGKSTIVQSIRMFGRASKGLSPLLGGLGDVYELRSKLSAQNESIQVQVEFDSGEFSTLKLSNNGICETPTRCPEILYVGADRFGPRASLPLSGKLDPIPRLGDSGEFVIEYIQAFIDNNYIVPEELEHENSEGVAFEYALNGWLSEIAPGVEFEFSTHNKADVSSLEVNSFRPTNVGFGLSYTLPVIAASLGMASYLKNNSTHEAWIQGWENKKSLDGRLLIVENPEAHLHPQGQTAMGRLLALVAASGVQVVVETHSDHVMDGIRLAIMESLISSDLVTFHYLSKDNDGLTQIITPKIDSNAKVDAWPDGFFDQTLKNRAKLAKRR